MLTECAWAGSKMKDSYYRKKYESLVIRRGKKRALIAVGHKILCASYHILKDKAPFRELGYDYLDLRRKGYVIQSYLDKLKNLGLEVEIKTG